MKHEWKFLICLSLLQDFKVKHREKMFSKDLLFVYYSLDCFPLFWKILSNLCKTIALEITQKWLYWTRGALQNTCRGLFLMVLQGKMLFIFLSPYTEFFVLEAFPQRCSTTKVLCKYEISLLESTHVEI